MVNAYESETQALAALTGQALPAWNAELPRLDRIDRWWRWNPKPIRLKKATALRYVLSDRANAGRVVVVDFGVTDTPSTKAAIAALTPVTENKFTTVVFSRDNVNEWLSVRNIPTVHPIFADQLNTYDVVTAQYVVFTKEGLEAFVDAKTKPAAKEA